MFRILDQVSDVSRRNDPFFPPQTTLMSPLLFTPNPSVSLKLLAKRKKKSTGQKENIITVSKIPSKKGVGTFSSHTSINISLILCGGIDFGLHCLKSCVVVKMWERKTGCVLL